MYKRQEQIAALPDKKLIMIAGPSSSGKTTFSHRLSIQLMAHGLKPHPIAVDNYFVERVDTPKDENGQYNFECLEAMDIEPVSYTHLDVYKRQYIYRYSGTFVQGTSEYHDP